MAKMLRLHGLRYIYPMMGENATQRFVNKTLFLIRNVLRENAKVCEVAVRSTKNELPFSRVLSLVGFENDPQTCELVAELLDTLAVSKTARAELLKLDVRPVLAR